MKNKEFENNYTIDHSSERLVKRKSSGDDPKEYLTGSVLTKYGLVDVESWIDPPLRTKKVKMTFLSFAMEGRYFTKTIQHYKTFTKTGLARMAGKFAEEKEIEYWTDFAKNDQEINSSDPTSGLSS